MLMETSSIPKIYLLGQMKSESVDLSKMFDASAETEKLQVNAILLQSNLVLLSRGYDC